MEINGIITHALEDRTGTSTKGDWKVQSWVMETQEQYPKSVCFEAFNKEWDLRVGQDVTVSINIESREYEGRWYTGIKGWKMEHNTDQAAPAPAAEIPPATNGGAKEIDDIPF